MNQTYRRDFLKTVGAAFTTSIFTSNFKGANDRLVGAVIGTGVMGRENLDVAARQPGVEITAICDVFQPNLERGAAVLAKRGKKAKEVKDFREILADRSVDFINISAPDHWHPYMTVEACKAGKDVYVEKPICVAVDEGLKMVEAARKYKRVVQAGTWQRSGRHFQRACEIVKSGALGKVTFAKAWIFANQPKEGIGNPPDGELPKDLDWDLWLGPAPKRPFNPNRFGVYPNAYSYFRYFWDYAGGIITDSGIHMIDIIHMAMGDMMPKSIQGGGGKLWFEDDTETPDTLQVTYEYPGFLGSWDHRSNNTEAMPARLMGTQFHGTKGTVYVDRAVLRVTPEKKSDLEPLEMKMVADPHPLHWENFIDCIRTRKRPNSDIELCFKSSAACILGNISFQARTRLDWDDAAKTVMQKEARKYLYREYRQPWKLEV
jgi:predicted dehydrogenase